LRVADIYRGQSAADELIAYDRKGAQAGIRGRERLAADLKLQNFDIALLLQNAFDAAWLTWRAGIPERIGYNRDGRGWLLTKAIDVPKTGDIPCHEKYYYLELLRRAGWIKTIPEVEEISLAISSDEVHRAEEKLRRCGSRAGATLIAIGAGSSYGSAKCWPPERFSNALNQVLAERDAEVILFGTPAESGFPRRSKQGLSRPAVDLTGRTRNCPICRLCFRAALRFSEMIPVRCTWPQPWDCRWWRSSVRLIHTGRTGDSALHDHSRKAVLQPVLFAEMSYGSSVHDRGCARSSE
jgi:heptosyltransferase-2